MSTDYTIDKRPYAVRIADFFTTETSHSDVCFVAKELLKNIDLKGVMPAFFYRHTMFSAKPFHISYDNGYHIQIAKRGGAGLMSIDEAMHFDYVMSNTSTENGNLVFRAEKEKLVSDIAIDYKTFLEAFSELFASIRTKEAFYRFQLFDYCHFASDGSVELKFSDATAVLYMIDYLVPTSHTRRIYRLLKEADRGKNGSERYGLKFVPILRNMLSRIPRSKAVKIPVSAKYFYRAGIEFDMADETAFRHLISNRNSTEISHALLGAGLNYMPTQTAFVIDKLNYHIPREPLVFVNRTEEKFEALMQKREEGLLWEIWAKRVAKRLDIDKDRVIAQAKGEEPVSVSVAQRSSDNSTASNDQGWINFELLEYNGTYDSIFDEHAVVISEEKREQVFNEFKFIYQDLQEKRKPQEKYKDPKRCLRQFLKVSYGINSGSADRIVFVERMEKIGKNAGLSEAEIETEFKKFKEYHTDVGNERKNWVSAWNTWVKNVVNGKKRGKGEQRTPKSRQYEMRVALENDYQVKKRIDQSIREKIKKAGISATDLINQKIVDKNIEPYSAVVPPSLGKGTETLFRFRDPKAQRKAEDTVWRTILKEDALSPQPEASKQTAETIEAVEVIEGQIEER